VDAKRQKAMELLRAAADVLEKEKGEWILPGWDEDEAITKAVAEATGQTVAECEARERGIRAAARAVAADGIDGDHCTRVPLAQLGFLVRYIGDMLEE